LELFIFIVDNVYSNLHPELTAELHLGSRPTVCPSPRSMSDKDLILESETYPGPLQSSLQTSISVEDFMHDHKPPWSHGFKLLESVSTKQF
jgi:hypothetical protein